jgi:hypothetical protein
LQKIGKKQKLPRSFEEASVLIISKPAMDNEKKILAYGEQGIKTKANIS